MHFNTLIAASILAVSASATASEPMPYKLAARSLNPFGNQAYGLTKRQSGYQPSQTFCSGYGTCAEACGTGYETCASTDGDLHCFDPTAKETCCPTGTGGMSPHNFTSHIPISLAYDPCIKANLKYRLLLRRVLLYPSHGSYRLVLSRRHGSHRLRSNLLANGRSTICHPLNHRISQCLNTPIINPNYTCKVYHKRYSKSSSLYNSHNTTGGIA